MNEIDGGLDGRLAEGTHITGKLEFDRAMQIDGRFDGEVKSSGKLILGPTAQVNAEINVGELEVQGTLRGVVNAKNRLLIRDGGVVEANIITGKLAIETGAVFRGACEMPEPEPTPAPQPKVEAKPTPAPQNPGMPPKATPAPTNKPG